MSNGSCLVWDYFGISWNTKKPFMAPHPHTPIQQLLKWNNKQDCSCQKQTKNPGAKESTKSVFEV